MGKAEAAGGDHGDNSGIERITEAIRRHHRFLITGHIDPDPDALGSVLAMKHMLTRLGKEAVATSPIPFPQPSGFCPAPTTSFRPSELKGPFDAFVIVDCAPDRIGTSWPLGGIGSASSSTSITTRRTPARSRCTGSIPHAAAAGEMVYRLCRAMGVDIDEPIATCLYTAILTDTGSFRFSNTTAETFAIAADLVSPGREARAHRGARCTGSGRGLTFSCSCGRCPR